MASTRGGHFDLFDLPAATSCTLSPGCPLGCFPLPVRLTGALRWAASRRGRGGRSFGGTASAQVFGDPPCLCKPLGGGVRLPLELWTCAKCTPSLVHPPGDPRMPPTHLPTIHGGSWHRIMRQGLAKEKKDGAARVSCCNLGAFDCLAHNPQPVHLGCTGWGRCGM